MKYTVFIFLIFIVLTTIIPCYAINYPFTTIDTAGFYKLATNVTNQITITVPNVTLDMNGCTVSGGANGVVINSNLTNVTIRNGTVNAVANGILVNAGCKDIILKDITAKSCIRGINVSQASEVIIRGCDMVLNTTGLHCDTSYNIFVENCMASANVQAGYSLLTSTTCTFIDCKALSTGDGNLNFFGDSSNVFGFISSSGSDNIFERCIANSTQQLTATDGNSVVAGFALRGTEACSKIIDCESSNVTTSPFGVTIPYGILLESRFDVLLSVTRVNPGDGSVGDEVFTLDWSPDGNYLAVGGILLGAVSNNDLFIYKFDRATEGLQEIIATNPGGPTIGSVNAVAWSPDGLYLAVGVTAVGAVNDLFIFRFDSVTGSLTEVTSANPDSGSQDDAVTAISWSSDGNYLAIGGDINGVTNNDLFIYRFDRVLETVTQVASTNPDGGSTADNVFTVDWSPDNQYLAVGGAISGVTNNDLFIYSFDRTSNILTQVATANPGGTTDTISQVDWSPDGKYLAVGVSSGATGLFLFRFIKATQTLTEIQAVNVNNGTVRSVNWSPDGKYLVVGAENATGDDLLFYTFNRSTESLFFLVSADPDEGAQTDVVEAVNWSPDGQYVAVGGLLAGTTGSDLFIYRTLRFPENNIIAGNTVYCNSGNNIPTGVGISGSSIVNVIIGNTAFDNPFNYQFVCNVFDQLFGEGPSILQNIAVASNMPILTPIDIPTRIKRTNLLLESLIDNLL